LQISHNGSRLPDVAGDPRAGRQTFRITAVRRCRVATRRTAEPVNHSAKERSDFAERSRISDVSSRLDRINFDYQAHAF